MHLCSLLLLFAQTPVTVPDQATSAFERGRRLYEVGDDMAGARAELDVAIRLAPDFAQAFLYRALVGLEQQNAATQAAADFERALKLDPNSKEAHRFYGESLMESGEIQRAEEHYRRALELDANYADALYLLAKIQRQKGQLDDAIALLEKHAQVSPKGSSHHVLGEIFLEKSDDARAKSEFEKDLAVDASCYESRLNLAGLALKQNDLARARSEYETSLTYHPADARALSGLGRTHLRLGDDELAVGTLRNALDLSPDDTEVKDALRQARLRQRLNLGWPFAVPPTLILLWMWRRRFTGA